MPSVTADMLRRGRDLAEQDAALQAEKDGLIFMETSQKEDPVILYSMADGEPIPMSPRIAELAIKKKYKGGAYLFTDRKEEAPEYKLGTVKCFLHPESEDREAGLLQAAGIAHFVCHSAHHPSKYAMREIAKSKHRKQWEALQEYLKEQDTALERAERRQQLEATLALAGKAAVAIPVETLTCDACGWTTDKGEASLVTHQTRWCEQMKEKADAGSPSLDEAQH